MIKAKAQLSSAGGSQLSPVYHQRTVDARCGVIMGELDIAIGMSIAGVSATQVLFH